MAKEPLRLMVEVNLEFEIDPEFVPEDTIQIGDMVQKMVEDKVNTPINHVVWWFADPENARQYVLPAEVKYGHKEETSAEDPTT